MRLSDRERAWLNNAAMMIHACNGSGISNEWLLSNRSHSYPDTASNTSPAAFHFVFRTMVKLWKQEVTSSSPESSGGDGHGCQDDAFSKVGGMFET